LSQLKVKFDGKTPVLALVKLWGLWGPCSGFGQNGGGLGGYAAKFKHGAFSLPVHGQITTEDGVVIHENGRITGRITKGTVTGTARWTEVIPQGASVYAWGTCDSGEVSWTAPRVSQLTGGHSIH
jgi:hypothetical protein